MTLLTMDIQKELKFVINMKTYILYLILFLCITQVSKAQIKEKVLDKVEQTLSSIIDGKNLKDSIALYTLSIQIGIKKSKGKIIVSSIKYNDIIGDIIFKDLNLLKEIDYSPLISNKHTSIINIPVAYIVANYKSNDTTEKRISLLGLQNNLYKLFNCTQNEDCNSYTNIYLKPFIITSDRAIYN